MKIKARASFYAYFFLIAILSSVHAVFAALCTLIVHETGHIIVAKMMRERIIGVEFTPFGGILHCETGKSASKGIRGVAVAAAGPAANYLSLVILGIKGVQDVIGTSLVQKLIIANTSMMMINLLPALPLDGGRIVLSIGFYLFRVTDLVDVLCALGCFAGAGMIALAIYGCFAHGMFNCSLVIIGIYLMVCARALKDTLIYENRYAVIKERQEDIKEIRRVKVYMLNPETKLFELLPIIGRSHATLFVFRYRNRNILVHEREILEKMLTDPSMTILTSVEH